MRAEDIFPERMEFSNARPKNRLVVENHEGKVIIRAARDNFSAREKAFFVRYLAAEGYIPDDYRGANLRASGLRLQWEVDPPGEPFADYHRQALRQIVQLVIGASLFWWALMLGAILNAP